LADENEPDRALVPSQKKIESQRPGEGTNMGRAPSLKTRFRAAFNHLKLYNDQFGQDINLRHNVFESYQLSDFIPFLEKDKPVEMKEVRASWYADEKDGTEWQGKLTATETQFNTYAYDVALNTSLHSEFPLGSFVKVIRQVDGEKKPREIVVRVTDVKGNAGLDLSKAAANDLGIRGWAKVTLQRMEPKKCDETSGKKKHPLASCYQDEVKLFWSGNRSKKFMGRRGKYDRDDFGSFNRFAWQVSDRIGKLGLNQGLVRPEVFGEHVPGTDHQMRWLMSAGPFSKMSEAIAFAEKYCSYCSEFQCSPDERSKINQECSGMTVYQHSWYNKAQVARYRRPKREVGVNPFLMKTEPQVVVADVIIDDDGDGSDDFNFDHLTVTLKTGNMFERLQSRQILISLKKLGAVELQAGSETSQVYKISKFTQPKDEVYFAIVDSLHVRYADLDFFFHTESDA